MRIQFINGEEAGQKRTINPPGLGIGRETDNEIQLLVGGVSRYHARIEQRGGQWILRDLGSTNGTKVNGILIAEPAILASGDVFSIGDQIFRVDDITGPAENENLSAGAPAGISAGAPAGISAGAPASNPNAAAAPVTPLPFVFRAPTAEEAPKAEAGRQSDTVKITPEEVSKPAGAVSAKLPFGNFFAKKEGATEQGKTSPLRQNSRNNILFYILVFMVAVLCVVLFWHFNQSGGKNGDAAAGGVRVGRVHPNPFVLYYEKLTVTPEHTVFKFKLLIENKHLSFSLDDLQSGRVYSPVITEEIRPEAIEKLKQTIASTTFMEAVQEEHFSDSADNDRNFTRIMVGYDDKFNDITVQDLMLASFSQVENAIHDFLGEEYGVDSSIAKSREELIFDAGKYFNLAEKQYGSYKTDPANLWKAIANYNIALKRYEVFAEKPAEWKVAREKLAEAENALETIRREGSNEVNLLYNQKEYARAAEECARLLDFFPQDTDTWKKIHSTKIQIEKIMSGENRR